MYFVESLLWTAGLACYMTAGAQAAQGSLGATAALLVVGLAFSTAERLVRDKSGKA